MEPLSQPNHHFDTVNLRKRVLSSLIAGPIAVGAVVAGSPYVELLSCGLLGVLLWEWSKMSKMSLWHPINGLVIFIMCCTLVEVSSFLLSLCSVVFVLSCLAFYYQSSIPFKSSLVLFSGPLYMGVGMIAILWLAKFTPLTLLWSLLTVWATDTGAYAIGNLMGGPKLIPKISPGKTWSGFLGGSLVGSAVAVAMASFCHISTQDSLGLFGIAFFLTIIGHLGDILESGAKRFFKVKDSSQIIPGHGGLWDRLDSVLLVAIFVVILKGLKIFS